MWIEINPRREDFCGRPPCYLCYRWGENNGVGMSGLERMSLELTGKFLDELTEPEKVELKKAADRIHKGALMPSAPVAELPPADLGMSDARHMDAWLAERKGPAVPFKPAQLTLDQRDDWQEPVEKSTEEAKRKVLKEKEDAKMRADMEAWAMQPKFPPSLDPRNSYLSNYFGQGWGQGPGKGP